MVSNQDTGARTCGDDAAGGLDAVDSGHVEVHHDDVRLLFRGEAYRLFAVGASPPRSPLAGR